MFCEMVAVHPNTMNVGASKELRKLNIHRAVTTAIHHNSGPQNATVSVPQVVNSPSFVGVNFISPPMTPTMPHVNHTNFGSGQK